MNSTLKVKAEPFLKRLSLTYLPIVASVAITICYLPQLWLTYTTHNVEGMSLSFWVMLDVALISLTMQQWGLIKYNGNRHKLGFYTELINTVFAVIQTVMIIVWR